MLSVCHLASGDRWAGAEAQISTLVRSLSRQPDVNVCAIVLAEGRLADEIRSAGVEVAVIPQTKNNLLGIYRKSAEFLKDRNIHIIHSHRYKEDLLAVMLRARLGVPRLVRTQHGSPEIATFKRQLVYAAHQLSARNVDAVVSVSGQLQDHLRTYLRAEQIRVIRNGIDFDTVRSTLSRQQAKEMLGVDAASPLIGVVARLDRVKRHDIFLNTAQMILRETPNATFVVAGAGKEENNLRSLARSLGVDERVMFLGHREDAYDILRALDVLLLTSDHEGLPMVVLEAMALGAVVMSRHVGGIPEVVRNGVDGVLVNSDKPRDLAANCMKVLNNEDFRNMLTTNAREKVRRLYSAEKNAEETLQMYRSILQEPYEDLPVDEAPVAGGENRAA